MPRHEGIASGKAGTKVGATVTDFVGREAELLHLAKLFGNARLVTVIGPGGVGKTSVSLRAAADATGYYPDGVWIVELSGLRDPELPAQHHRQPPGPAGAGRPAAGRRGP